MTTTAIMNGNLPGLADAIKREHGLCQTALGEGLLHAANVGKLLMQAKALCAHGTWGAWLADNCEFSERTAQAYMRVANRWPEVEAKAQRVADLPFRGALALLAEPKAAEYEVHELGLIFPPMQPDEFNGLVESIQELGLINPIALFEGKILDGKERYRACKVAGVSPHFNVFPDDFPAYRGNALDFVISKNLHRQHFTKDQEAFIALNAMPYLEAEASE